MPIGEALVGGGRAPHRASIAERPDAPGRGRKRAVNACPALPARCLVEARLSAAWLGIAGWDA